MADHFKFHPGEDAVVAPWTATYSYPSQSNKALKNTARIQPKSGQAFGPGQIARIDLPAQGYVNTTNTQLVMDVVLYGPKNTGPYAVRFQNNIACIINRMRFLYGGTPHEDIQQYGVLTRCLTEWTTTNQMGTVDQTSVSDGVGGFTQGVSSFVTSAGPPAVYGSAPSIVNVRQRFIQGLQSFTANLDDQLAYNAPTTNEVALPAGCAKPSDDSGIQFCVRRYQISLALGLFTQDKLLPTKWLASQLTIEITFSQANDCIYQPIGADTNSIQPTFLVGNMELILEQIDFDDQYDQDFLNALESKGVPIKFSTWDWFSFGTMGASSNQYQISERSRSIKGMFCVQRRSPPSFAYDSHACLYDTAATYVANGTSTLQQAQWRVGGRYTPGAPTQYSANVGSSVSNGGAEGLADLQKFLNTIGNYSLQTNTSVLNFAVPAQVNHNPPKFPEYDYSYSLVAWDRDAVPITLLVETGTINGGINTCGNMPSSCFATAINFETSNGIEISGLNGEEQTDIAYIVRWSNPQTTGFVIEAYIYVDKMWVIKPNNYIDLIE